ncbi:MAG: DUF3106 domain-containing protein [Verrucomicrobiota bacterium]|nr:DUF3106 domain-containing protein [Verrucomicrobiota bacterium]
MNGVRRGPWRAGAVVAAGLAFALSSAAETSTNTPIPFPSAGTNAVAPSLPPLHSPIDFFRKLLAMTPAEREKELAGRPPAIRERILAKVHEYEALDPNERELRLRATELRWYLMPLLRESPTNRAAQLQAVPRDIRGLVASRLAQWEILPPPLQKEFLEDDRALNYFAHVDPSGEPPMPPGLKTNPSDEDIARWNALSAAQRCRIAGRVNLFFELTPQEKQETLGQLSAPEREQMEKTLQAFDHMPPEQRQECVRAFTKFAGMSAVEKEEFLTSAQRWSQMSPADRQTWRDLVKNVPEWPPLPTGFVPPPAADRPRVATNRN